MQHHAGFFFDFHPTKFWPFFPFKKISVSCDPFHQSICGCPQVFKVWFLLYCASHYGNIKYNWIQNTRGRTASTWDTIFVWLGITDKQIWKQFFQPTLSTWWWLYQDSVSLWECHVDNDKALLQLKYSLSSASAFWAMSITYQRNKLVWFEVSCSRHTLVACFYHFIIFKALDMDCSVICSRIFIDWLVYDDRHLHIVLSPSSKGFCPFSFSGAAFVLPRFPQVITNIWESILVSSKFS